MPRAPAKELLNVLEHAYGPCTEFQGACAGAAAWAPEHGHVPRGFLGAASRIDDVELVLLIAEPGNPHPHSRFGPDLAPQSIVAQTVSDTYRCFREKTDLFHYNMRRILDLAFPELALDDQLRRVWITNSRLCSAPEEGGSVPVASSNACAGAYLKAQLELLSGRPIIALGHKANDRALRLRRSVPDLRDRLFRGYAASPPGCNHRGAHQSWREAVSSARGYLRSSFGSAAID